MAEEVLTNQKPAEIDEDSLFHRVPLNERESEHLAAEPYSYWKSVFRIFIRRPSAIISIVCLFLLVTSMIIIPLFAYDGALESNTSQSHLAPSFDHFFGTDLVGKDLFFSCFKGLQLSMLLAIISPPRRHALCRLYRTRRLCFIQQRRNLARLQLQSCVEESLVYGRPRRIHLRWRHPGSHLPR